MTNDPLLTLLDVAERQRDEALAALLLAESTQRRLQLQAQQLRAYRDEYLGRAPASQGRAAPIEMLRTHQAFMGRLDQAVAQLQAQLAAADQDVARRREQVLAQEQRVASVRKLLQRREHEARRLEDRAEQRRSDEAALRRTWGGMLHPATR